MTAPPPLSSLSPAVTAWRQQRQVLFRWTRLSCLLALACPAGAPRGQRVLQGEQRQVRGRNVPMGAAQSPQGSGLCLAQPGEMGTASALPFPFPGASESTKANSLQARWHGQKLLIETSHS